MAAGLSSWRKCPPGRMTWASLRAPGTRAFVVNLSAHRRTVVLTGAVSATIDANPSSLSVIDLPGRPS